MSAFEWTLTILVALGALVVALSILDDLLHRRRLRGEESLAEVHQLHNSQHLNDPCVVCAHPRQAHTVLARGRRRGACQTPECLCAHYTPDRQEAAQ